MLIPFVAANAVLWVALIFNAIMVTSLQSGTAGTPVQWLAVMFGGSVAGVATGRLYDAIIPAMSQGLRHPITPGMFSAASIWIIVLVLAAATRTAINWFQPPYSAALVLTALALSVLGGIEIWPHLPSDIPAPVRLMFAPLIGAMLLGLALMAPLLVFQSFAQLYNAGMAACVSGWVAGLVSRQLRTVLGSRALEPEAAGKAVKAIVQRDVPVLIAVVLTYAVVSIAGLPPILFAVVVGLLSPILTWVLAEAFA